MKPVIIFAITLVAGLGAGTGAKVMTAKPAPAVADSTKADSLKADSLKADSTKGEGGEHAVQQAGDAKSMTDTAVVASGAAEKSPIEVAPASPVPTRKPSASPTAATQSNAAAVAAALEARVDSAKHAAAKAVITPVSTPIDTAVQASQRRVAKIFTSMDAKAAAKVLEQMNDNDIHIILGYVGPKQAASILTALPPERVAKLSKLDMGTK